MLRHDDHGIRHPASAYSTSLRLIALQWIKFLDQLEKLRAEYLWEGKTTSATVATAEYAQLLHRLNEHQDACYAVLRAVCPPDRAKPNHVDANFLEKAKLPGWKKFREATRAYREDHVGLIVNNLKHRQGELSSISFQSPVEFRPGYFLRDVLQTGVIGPSRKLHSGGNTAFSFARDQLMHLWWLYRIGDLLTSTLTTVVSQLFQRVIVVTTKSPGSLPWNGLLSRLSALKPEYYPDELKKPQPLAFLSVQPSTFSIEFPSKARGIPLNAVNLRISTDLTVDCNYPSNKMPYFGHMP
ncbi:hypothetical protein GALL_506340 [mine drainage metagenome]|uniref:Uncharacterized protein n=1 Tax=mine drainage metagenome TaxID=410659 RepID=A0A1J5P876_9ZZZZ